MPSDAEPLTYVFLILLGDLAEAEDACAQLEMGFFPDVDVEGRFLVPPDELRGLSFFAPPDDGAFAQWWTENIGRDVDDRVSLVFLCDYEPGLEKYTAADGWFFVLARSPADDADWVAPDRVWITGGSVDDLVDLVKDAYAHIPEHQPANRLFFVSAGYRERMVDRDGSSWTAETDPDDDEPAPPPPSRMGGLADRLHHRTLAEGFSAAASARHLDEQLVAEFDDDPDTRLQPGRQDHDAEQPWAGASSERIGQAADGELDAPNPVGPHRRDGAAPWRPAEPVDAPDPFAELAALSPMGRAAGSPVADVTTAPASLPPAPTVTASAKRTGRRGPEWLIGRRSRPAESREDLGVLASHLVSDPFRGMIVPLGNPKGGTGKTTTAIGVSLVLDRVLTDARVNDRIALVDSNLRMSDTWRQLRISPGAMTFPQLVFHATRNLPLPDWALQYANANAPHLVVFPEEEGESEGYLLSEIQAVAMYLRRYFSAIVVDLPNDLPDVRSRFEQVVQWWLTLADVCTIPTLAESTALDGADRFQERLGHAPGVLAYLSPQNPAVREHPKVQQRLAELVARPALLGRMCPIPEERDKVRLAGLNELNLLDAGPELRRGYADLTKMTLAVNADARLARPRRVGPAPYPT